MKETLDVALEVTILTEKSLPTFDDAINVVENIFEYDRTWFVESLTVREHRSHQFLKLGLRNDDGTFSWFQPTFSLV